MSLKGRRIAITAAATGIGRITAETLSAAGASVFISDVDDIAIATTYSETHIEGIRADVTNPDEVQRFCDVAAQRFGGIDVLINNAGIAGPTESVEKIDVEEWRRTLEINITGQFLCARSAVPYLRQSQCGQIINMASVAGRLGYAFRTPYAASKWAVIGFTKSLAKELGQEGIRVNAILPGIVEGPRTEGVIRARSETLNISYDEMKERYLQKISMRTMVSAQDVADMIAFLCSPMARLISGQSISVDGNVEDL